MLIERSSSKPAALGSWSTSMTTAERLFASLMTSKEYREGFVEEAVQSRITAQISALREKGGGDYEAFADKIGKKTSWVYRLEDPTKPPPTISSLLEVAAACDVGLDVRFCRFSELVHDVSTLNKGSFYVPSFEEELKEVLGPQHKRGRNVRSDRHKPRPKSGAAATGVLNSSVGGLGQSHAA